MLGETLFSKIQTLELFYFLVEKIIHFIKQVIYIKLLFILLLF